MGLLKRQLRHDSEGVASTVGTIMALLVFLTFLSLIVNQYVPVWMKDSESAHMNTALGQFGGLKGAIDLQVLAAQIAQNAGSHYIPVTSSTAVTLGLDGVPIFAAPTVGEIVVKPDAGPWTVAFYYSIRGVLTKSQDISSGVIELNVDNRYFIPQRIAYENGAVIRYQIDGQVIRAQPIFEPQRVNNSIDLSFQLISLYGRGSVAGTTTEIVNTKLFGLDRQDYGGAETPIKSTIWVNHTSTYGLAWYNFFNSTLSRRLGITSGQYTVSASPTTILFVRFIGKLNNENIYQVQATYDSGTNAYQISLQIFKQTELPVSAFRLQHAYVQVGIGENTEEILL